VNRFGRSPGAVATSGRARYLRHRGRFWIPVGITALLVLVPAAATSASTGSASAAPVVAPNGAPGGNVAAGHGSDQGEDQGENIAQYGAGTKRLGPTTVHALNTITSGDAGGGHGGSVTVTFNNFVTTACTSGASALPISPQPVVINAGSGGRGGSTGTGQGSDQGEDQGENIGQNAKAGGIGPSTVGATNTIHSGPARGGDGGDVNLTFNEHTLCLGSAESLASQPPSGSTVTHDAEGNLIATFVTHTSCSSSSQPLVIRAGSGGAGGSSGHAQGADQGEDQGENIGQFANGSSQRGPTKVDAINTLTAPDATGGDGRSVTATFDNYIDGTCASAAAQGSPPVVVTAGSGGRGGISGSHQGSDQGEDQGENIGQFATGGAVIGRTSVSATNSIVSDEAGGGHGGTVNVTYNDLGTCPTGTLAGASADERVTAKAGGGGRGGSSGSAQGSDQGEDQGENVGQYATGGAKLRATSVTASNTNSAAGVNGGHGGDVVVTFHAGSCVHSGAGTEGVLGAAGNGGNAGASGKAQGADQAEDQGENVGQYAAKSALLGSTTVHAVNLNHSGDAIGGDGGNVTVTVGTSPCSTAAPGPDGRVGVTPGLGGRAGTSGVGQGADQGEDQGENVGLRSKGTAYAADVSAHSRNEAGQAVAGHPGVLTTNACTSALHTSMQVRRLAVVDAQQPLDPDIKPCDGVFHKRAIVVLVTPGSVCTLARGSQVAHNVEVRPGGTLIDNGATIGHDLRAYRAAEIIVTGGTIAHDLVIDQLAGGSGRNRICGAAVKHNLAVQNGFASAGVVVVGGARPCAGNVVGHDLVVVENLGGASVSYNHAGHDLNCFANASLRGAGNRASHAANSCPTGR
jgi:hypothetical protein